MEQSPLPDEVTSSQSQYNSENETSGLGQGSKESRKVNNNAAAPKQPPPPQQNVQPAYMGDILDDIFGGSFRTPGVKASEDILLTKTITPAIAFEELSKIRQSPTLFMLFYSDAKDKKVLESLHFILEVEEFMALPVDFRMTREKEIIENYLEKGATFEINIPDTHRKIITEKCGKKQEDIFTDAQKYITHMLIRNVDSTWKYKQVQPPKKELKGREIKRAIDKVTDDDRTRDLIFYFVARRITPLMYQARTSVVSLQRKVRTSAPIGYAHVKIKELTNFVSKSTSGTTIYVNGRCFYRNAAGYIRDKKTKARTIPQRGTNSFAWEDILTFDIKDIDTQGIEFHLWEKRIIPNVVIGAFEINLRDLVEQPYEEIISEISINLEDEIGQILLEFHYQPNEEEIRRLQEEKEKRDRDNASRSTVSPEFDFLMS